MSQTALHDFCEPSQRAGFLADVRPPSALAERKLSVLLLADDTHVANVVRNHFGAIEKYSRHTVTVINPRVLTSPSWLSKRLFDAIVIHYSIYVLSEAYLSDRWARFIAGFSGTKIAIHEDEYHSIDAFKARFADLKIDGLVSCLDSPDTLRKVYGGREMADTLLFCGLPGYVSDNDFQFHAPPIDQRPLHVVYRGRTLPPQLGRFAQEKREIGEKVAAVAEEFGLRVDISSEENDRIYGDEWPRFLRSGRAMLGVEGGASIFDFDGSIARDVDRYRSDHPGASFEDIWSAVLEPHEGNILYKTLTPKFFEAIIAKTALVIFPGKLSGILVPDRHYIPLERDLSNFADVASKLKDCTYLQDLVDRTYEEIALGKDIHVKSYVERLDDALLLCTHRKQHRQSLFDRLQFYLQTASRKTLDDRQKALVRWRAEQTSKYETRQAQL